MIRAVTKSFHPLLFLAAILPAAAQGPIPLETLREEIGARTARVAEFRFIAEEAHKLGARVWLFGGTAAAYAHYVRWDLQREQVDTRFQPDRFDYDYTNIFRSTQDIDIVIDGTSAQARALESALKDRFPHLQGNKSVWEVRLLRSSMGDKEALLDNPNFLNQHSDSHSTGMIELGNTAEARVRDIRDWNNSVDPVFLRDVHSGALHYYFSSKHRTTSRYLAGKNPEIFSVVRYLTKAFQYELEIPDESLANLERVLGTFDAKRDLKNPYCANWIEKNGSKLVQNAVNVEYAIDTLKTLGLLEKLVAAGDARQVESMGWWLSKEPLRSRPVGQGDGQTARELARSRGIAWEDFIVAHETNNFLAYESITRAHTGEANVFVSRENAVGESAVHGWGFYAKFGRKGAKGTGITVRFRVHPDAREGADFVVSGEFLIFRNRNAIQVIPESLNYGPVEYFRMLASGLEFDASERGIAYRLGRRIKARVTTLSGTERDEIAQVVRERFEEIRDTVAANYAETIGRGATIALAREWFSMPVSREHPEITDILFDALEATRPNGVPRIPFDSKGFFATRALLPLFQKDHPDFARAAGLFWRISRELHPETWGWEERYRAVQTTDLILHPDAPKGLAIWIHNERKNSRVAAHFFSSGKWRGIPEAGMLFERFLQTITKGDHIDLFHVLLRLLEPGHSNFPGFDHAALRATILERALRIDRFLEARGLAIAYFVKCGAFHSDPQARQFMFENISDATRLAFRSQYIRNAFFESDLWESEEGVSLIRKFAEKRPLQTFDAMKSFPKLLDHAAFVRFARVEAVHYGPEIAVHVNRIPAEQLDEIFRSPARGLDFLKILVHAGEYGPKGWKQKKQKMSLPAYRQMLKEHIQAFASRPAIANDPWFIANCGKNPSFETLSLALKKRPWSKELPGGSLPGLGKIQIEPKTFMESLVKTCAKLLRRLR